MIMFVSNHITEFTFIEIMYKNIMLQIYISQ